MNYLKVNIVVFVMLVFSYSCGTLGGFDERVFPVAKNQLNKAFDSLYATYPEYNIPEKWKQFDDWKERGYDFLDSRLIYFKEVPEEMYYVSFIGDPTSQSNLHMCRIAIRAVCKGRGRWLLVNDFNRKEKDRIENRFDTEIIDKLELFLKVRVIR
jgi:hypothetical protein